MKASLVSVIIPTYNGETTLERAVNSVLNQTYPNIEIIIVDDASTDNTYEVAKSLKDRRIQVLRHKENKNGAAARNTGIKNAKGAYIAFLDDDDEWLPNKLKLQIQDLKTRDSNIWKGSVTGYSLIKNSEWKDHLIKKEGDLRKDILLMTQSLGAGSSLLISKDVVKSIGHFNERYRRHQDIEYFLRYLRKYKLAVVQAPLIKVYGHPGMVSGDKLVQVKNLFLKDFEQDIKSFGNKTAKKIYARQWLQVARSYAVEGNIKKTFEYLRKSLSYAILPSAKYPFLIFEGYIALPYLLLKGIIEKLK